MFQAATPLLTGTCRINVAESIQHPRRHCCTCLSVYVGQYTREHSTLNDDKKKIIIQVKKERENERTNERKEWEREMKAGKPLLRSDWIDPNNKCSPVRA